MKTKWLNFLLSFIKIKSQKIVLYESICGFIFEKEIGKECEEPKKAVKL